MPEIPAQDSKREKQKTSVRYAVSRQRPGYYGRDRARHGCRARAYRDVFTACPARNTPDAGAAPQIATRFFKELSPTSMKQLLAIPLRQIPIPINPPITQIRPDASHGLSARLVDIHQQYFIAIDASAAEELTLRPGNETVAPELDATVTGR